MADSSFLLKEMKLVSKNTLYIYSSKLFRVLVVWENIEKDSKLPNLDASKDHKSKLSADSPRRISNDSPYIAHNAGPISCSSPDVGLSPSGNRPPKIPTETLTRRKSLSRSVYSKPKSRFGEQSLPLDTKMFEENGSSTQEHIISSRGSPITKIDANSTSIKDNIRPLSITPKTPLMSSPGGFRGVDEDEEIYRRVNSRKKLKHRKLKAKVLIEWLLFLCIVGCLIASVTIDEFQGWRLWGLRIWKWCVLVLVTFSGLMVTAWLIRFFVLLIELNFLLKRKVLYFVYGLKKSVQVCIWLSLVLGAWVLLFQEGVGRTSVTTKILHYITWTIASLLIGAFLWLLKTLLLKILAASFHVNSFFDRIQVSIFHQYILFTLSGLPVMESAQMLGKSNSNASQFSFRVTKKGKEGKEKNKKEVIDINKLHQMKQEKVSAWTMKMGNEQADKEITNKEEAIAAAYHIFRNVAQPGCNYIDELDLRRFMIKEEVDFVFPMIDTAETGQINRKALTEWVVCETFSNSCHIGSALILDTMYTISRQNNFENGMANVGAERSRAAVSAL
ncbi:mechanosensitive ion channel protein 10-like [Olea europaea var. sylvestris]|uniref:mechanosensitive ion channel protein 10-like n=1 Tax=Olea europaea var. sylvestris TaxID=158386 RepID=UPI000C1CFB76|nr:mechanosensitive ion channel protein 10-like [Olea europaea var. sylvestris]